ncbi:MAG: hypothetical protein ACE5DN_07485, partial [Flavobacteriales bacterium]
MKLLYTTHAMLFLFFPGSISAQRCVNYVQLRFSDSIAYNKSSTKPYTGCFRKMKNGRIILEGKFKNGRKDSVWVAFRDDGSFKSQKLYMAGHPKVDWE